VNWLILRVFAGLPLHVERTIRDMSVPAYCPAETIKRRHPRGKHVIVQRRPILPGYVFVAANEDWNTPTLTPAFPLEAILTTRVKARWLQLGERLCYLRQREVDALRLYEQSWRPGFDDFVHALTEISRGVTPKKNRFIRFSDFQALAKTQGQDVFVGSGRAA
jgi:hypothetical protein